MMLIQVAPGQSLQTVIDALPADDQPVTIHLAPGVYEEKIALRRPHTRIEGESAETTRITWHDGAAEILPDGKKRGTFRTATLLVNARDCALRNVMVENSAYPREQVGQALALYVDGDGFHCEDCTLKSCQDTLFTAPLPPREIQKDGFIGPTQFLPRIPQRQVYRHCRIEGDIDFIFGGAAAWFEDCDIVSIDGLRDHGDKKEPALGFCTAAMALRDDSVRLDDARLAAEQRLAIVMGTEGDGLADATIASCDYTVRIPMHHGVDSLNVAAASAVAFYQLGRA